MSVSKPLHVSVEAVVPLSTLSLLVLPHDIKDTTRNGHHTQDECTQVDAVSTSVVGSAFTSAKCQREGVRKYVRVFGEVRECRHECGTVGNSNFKS